MEEQAKGLAEMVGNESQLKELYDSLDQEDKKNAEEFKRLKDEMTKIIDYLNSLNIPASINGRNLSVYERISTFLSKKCFFD